MIIKGSCRDFRIIKKSSRDPLIFSRNIVRGMPLKHAWSLTIYGGRFFNFITYFWTLDIPKLVKCCIGIVYQLTCFVSVLRHLVERLPTSRVSSSKIASSCKVSTIPRNKGHTNLLKKVIGTVNATIYVIIVLFSRG